MQKCLGVPAGVEGDVQVSWGTEAPGWAWGVAMRETRSLILAAHSRGLM